MKIQSIELKNFASYGNKIQKIEFEEDKSELFLTVGKNGEGKCLSKDTKLSIDIDDEQTKADFILFMKNRK